ncbi:MAG: gliding motility-associated C-terminal domain-containing protein, partial [Sphingobacteriales bacterium]
MNTKLRLLIALLCCNFLAYSQVDIALYKQFNGRYDFTFVGNTLNTETNKYNNTYIPPCTILTSSSASLALNPGDAIQAAYLYWAGSGTGDLSVKLNNTNITAQRVFDVSFASNGVTRPYFGAFADVTTLVQSTGTGNYTVSEFDLTSLINQNVDPALNTYCQNGTNFGGWVIVVVYKNDAIPFNQVNIYDGMEFVPDEVNITLNGLNIIDNVGAKTGFVAWEGDIALDDDETLTINNNTLSNALNPPTNAFNSSNTVTGSSQLWNMDLDIYDVSNYVNIGDTSASIKLTSGADFVMINTIVTRLFSIAPDATVVVNGITQTCDSRTISVNYTVHNDNATAPLPANTPVSVYLNGDHIGNVATQASIPIGGSESGTYTLTIPAGAPLDFQLIFIADDNGTGIGTVDEIDETNNSFTYTNSLWISPVVPPPANLTACAVTDMTGTFNLTGYEQSLKQNDTDVVTFYTMFEAAQLGTDFIQGTAAYDATANPQTIFVRVTDV